MKLFGVENISILKCVAPYAWGLLTSVAVSCCTDEQYDRLFITSSYVGGAGSDSVLPVLQS